MFGVKIMREDSLQNFCQRMIIIPLKNTLKNIQNSYIWIIFSVKEFLMKAKKMSYSVKC